MLWSQQLIRVETWETGNLIHVQIKLKLSAWLDTTDWYLFSCDLDEITISIKYWFCFDAKIESNIQDWICTMPLQLLF